MKTEISIRFETGHIQPVTIIKETSCRRLTRDGKKLIRRANCIKRNLGNPGEEPKLQTGSLHAR